MRFLSGAVGLAAALCLLGGCTKSGTKGANAAPEAVAKDELATRGKGIYAASCTACHNADPSKDGALGPAIAGSELTLIERRVVYGDYPEGYKPKRDSKLMVALPHLKGEVSALHAYLSSLGK